MSDVKRYVKSSGDIGKSDWPVNVDADFDDLVESTDFTEQDVSDVEDVVRDFTSRSFRVLDSFAEQFGVRVSTPEINIYSLGPDTLNFEMFCKSTASDMGVYMARFFEEAMKECGRRISSRSDKSKFDTYTEVDPHPNDPESTGTFHKDDVSL